MISYLNVGIAKTFFLIQELFTIIGLFEHVNTHHVWKRGIMVCKPLKLHVNNNVKKFEIKRKEMDYCGPDTYALIITMEEMW